MKLVPGHWMNEQSGVLRPAIEAFLAGGPMTHEHIAAMRAYLRQWMAGDWRGPGIDVLRSSIDDLTSRKAINTWLCRAFDEGIDPL